MPDRGYQVYTPFTADRSILAGGEAFARGMSTGLASIAEGITERAKEEKKFNADAKRFEATYKGNKKLQEMAGLTPDQFSALSSRDKVSVFSGAMTNWTLQQQQAAEERSAAESQMKIDTAMANRKQAGSIMRALGNQGMRQRQQAAGPFGIPEDPVAQTPGFGAMSPEALDAIRARSAPGIDEFDMAVLQGSAEAGTPIDPGVLRDMGERSREGGGLGTSDYEDPVTGSRFVFRGRTAYPSGVNPAKIATVTITDPNTGQLVDVPVNPRTGQALMTPRPPAATKPRELSPSFQKIQEIYGTGVENKDPAKAAAARAIVKTGIDGEHAMGIMTDEQRDQFYTFYGIPVPKKATTAAPGAGAKGGAAKISKDPLTGKYLPKDQAEYDSLPSGARYVDPNGVESVKP